EGLDAVFARLTAGDVEPAHTAAAVLLNAFADELFDTPAAIAELARLFPHQVRGIAELAVRLKRYNVALLADSVGLGKTRLACALIRTLRDRGELKRAAIVTPRKIERNWRIELDVVGLEEGRDVTIINKDAIKRWTPEESAKAFHGHGLFVIEEA